LRKGGRGDFFMPKRLITTNFHIPYNPGLKDLARELRKNLTPAEKQLWYKYLRDIGLPFLRQKPLDNYIVDFYCANKKLVIEIDGDSHYINEAQENDRERTKVLTSYGLTVLRFTNTEVMDNLEGVCMAIGKYLEQ
jgi:very-short-patch-repair endonuclease